jgi:hypothetical protein
MEDLSRNKAGKRNGYTYLGGKSEGSLEDRHLRRIIIKVES